MNQIKYLVLVLLSIFFNIQILVSNTNQSNIMFSPFSFLFSMQQLNEDLRLEEETSMNGDTKTNRVVLINNKTNKRLVLREDSFLHGKAWKEFEKRGEIPLGYYNITGALLDDKYLYVAYSIFGKISLHKYHFIEPEKYEEEEREIASFFITPAYGSIISGTLIKKINNSLYIYMEYGQEYSKKEQCLLKISDNLSINTLTFIKPSEFVAGMYLKSKDDLLDDLRQIERNRKYGGTVDLEEEKELLEIKDAYFDVPYLLRQLDSESDVRKKQLRDYSRRGLKPFSFYDNQYSEPKIDVLKLEETVSEVLTYLGYDGDITYLDIINTYEMIYIFYLDNRNQLKILRYDYNNAMWIISDYERSENKK